MQNVTHQSEANIRATMANVSSDAPKRQIAELDLLAPADGVCVRAEMQKFAANVVVRPANHVVAVYVLRPQRVRPERHTTPILAVVNAIQTKTL